MKHLKKTQIEIKMEEMLYFATDINVSTFKVSSLLSYDLLSATSNAAHKIGLRLFFSFYLPYQLGVNKEFPERLPEHLSYSNEITFGWRE